MKTKIEEKSEFEVKWSVLAIIIVMAMFMLSVILAITNANVINLI